VSDLTLILVLCCSYLCFRDTLFCFHKASEAFLQRLVSLYVASHYKVGFLSDNFLR
jgi:tRNA(Met) C34 N-acetyltransferase TmcA